MHRLRLKRRRQSSDDGYGPRRRGSFAGVVVEDHDVQKKMVGLEAAHEKHRGRNRRDHRQSNG